MHLSFNNAKLSGELNLCSAEQFDVCRILERLPTVASLELWILGSAIKKVNERLRQIQHRGLEALRVAFLEPRVLQLPERNLLFHVVSRKTFPCLVVGLRECCKGLIPNPSRATERLS